MDVTSRVTMPWRVRSCSVTALAHAVGEARSVTPTADQRPSAEGGIRRRDRNGVARDGRRARSGAEA